MAELKVEEICLENKQLMATSSSSVSEEEGSGSVTVKSPGISSPATTSPSHRYAFLTLLLLHFGYISFFSSVGFDKGILQIEQVEGNLIVEVDYFV